jgi:hypothetical protein
MATQDITRFLHRPKQHYVGVRMQQGRTILDSDWNEEALLEAEDRRATLLELVGSHGSTNAGFRISKVVGALNKNSIGYDFTIAAGSFLLGGMRFCLEQAETYRTQRDWLGVDARPGLLPDAPTTAELKALPGGVRYDLVYLHAWEQPVSAVEDHELRERALGGPDSSTRLRRMRRVEIAPNVGTDVPTEAFEAMFASLEEADLAHYDHATAELVSHARLTVGFVADPNPSPCDASAPAGYVGYEDQAIRVELRGKNKFCWGYCNAAPVYRVRVNKNDPTRLRFINQPRDDERAPKIGQIVELLPWSAKLPNDEKVAELQGALARVTIGYDPKSREIVIDQKLPAEWLDWLETHEQHLSERDGDNKRYLYLRVWDRNSDTESPPLIRFSPGKPVPLAGTGLQVTFDPSGRSGDYWIIAARKATPAKPTPWDLLTGAAPHGTRHFYAPLAVIRWSLEPKFGAEIRDARRTIRRLGERGCCTISVGNGIVSHGLVDSFEDAVAELPPEGGRICLLPGTHNLDGMGTISDRANIEIVGCGPTTVVTNTVAVVAAPAFDTHGDPIITLEGCSDIRLRDFKITADARVGVKMDALCKRVSLDRMEFAQTGTYNAGPDPDTFALSQPAVMALGVEDLCIRRCHVEVEDEISYTPAVVLGGTGIRLLDSRILTLPAEHPAASNLIKPMGGVHILSQSVDVEIAGNIIRGGWGYGIALGHVVLVDTLDLPDSPLSMTKIWEGGERGLGEVVVSQLGGVPHAGMVAPTMLVNEAWAPCGPMIDIRIHRNEIFNMSFSGISTSAWKMVDVDTDTPVFLVVVDLDVACNYIHDNARIKVGLTEYFAEDLVLGRYGYCLGGIALAGAISPQFRENQIVRNHMRDTVTPSDDDVPNVGIGVIAGQNVVIEDNRIIDNGITSTTETPTFGLRGGIAIEEVMRVVGYTFKDSISEALEIPRPEMSFLSLSESDPSESALTVRKNEVSQPYGKALWVRQAFGPVNVTENVLQAFGDPSDAIDDAELEVKAGPTLSRPARGACVEILAVALSAEHAWGGATNIPTPALVDPTSDEVYRGIVSFCGNTTILDWTVSGGHATAVLISSLDAVVANDNFMTANMHNTNEYDDGYDFLTTVIGTPASASFLLFHCYLGATGTVQAKGNRIEEGQYDAPYSLLCSRALSPWNTHTALDKANLVDWNVGSHCILADDTQAEQVPLAPDTSNISIYSVQMSGSGCPYFPGVYTHTAGPPLKVTVDVGTG